MKAYKAKRIRFSMIRNEILFFGKRYFFVSCLSLKRLQIIVTALVLFIFSSTLLYAQDSTKISADEYTNDTAKAEDNFDTTGYYFNWKEYPTDAYTNEKIGTVATADSGVQKLKEDDDFWYVKSIEQFKKNANRIRYDKSYRDSLRKAGLLSTDEQVFTQEQNSVDWYLQAWFINTIWTLIVGVFIATVIFFLLSKKINLFSKKAAKGESDNDSGEKNVFSINYDELLNKYQEQKNFRLAVRVLYLQLLKILSEKSIIHFQPHFTNTQYLHQLSQSHLYNEFVKVTRHYDYAWYGEFIINEAMYKIIKSDFAKIKNDVTN